MAKVPDEPDPTPARKWFDPADLLHFVELDEFTEDWIKLGLNDDDMWALEFEIMSAPEKAPLIQGTGGLRKLRFAPAQWRIGKSGATRVCYSYFKQEGIVLLVMAYGKNKKDSLSAQEKTGIKAYLERIKKWLSER